MLSQYQIQAQMSRCQRIFDNMDPPDYDDRYWPLDDQATLDIEKQVIIERYPDECGWVDEERPIRIRDFDIYPEMKNIIPEVLEELLSGDDGSCEGD